LCGGGESKNKDEMANKKLRQSTCHILMSCEEKKEESRVELRFFEVEVTMLEADVRHESASFFM
jgi:hypothetical protein